MTEAATPLLQHGQCNEADEPGNIQPDDDIARRLEEGLSLEDVVDFEVRRWGFGIKTPASGESTASIEHCRSGRQF